MRCGASNAQVHACSQPPSLSMRLAVHLRPPPSISHRAVLKALFEPRPPVEPKPPMRVPTAGTPSALTGVAAFLGELETAVPPPRAPSQHPSAVALRRKSDRLAAAQAKIREQKATWDPSQDPKATGDAFSTLFVGRLNHTTTEDALKKAFGEFGPIVKLRHVVRAWIR